MPNALYYEDNLDVMRYSIAGGGVDLAYLDPPFNSNANYNVLFRSTAGGESEAQIEAFKDTWHWGIEAEAAFDEVLRSGNTTAAELMRAMRTALRDSDIMAYLAMMAVRLIELHRVLKPTGSLYLHCDTVAGHYLKLLLDAVFGAENFINEIIWKRTGAHSDARQGSAHFGRVHDLIFFYSKGPGFKWQPLWKAHDPAYLKSHYSQVDESGRRFRWDNITGPGGAAKGNPFYEVLGVSGHWRYSKERMAKLVEAGLVALPRPGAKPSLKRYLDEQAGTPVTDVWDDISPLNSQAQERLGYPTQKPLALLERILRASSAEGDLILDPFCGCGTTIHAAQKLGRQWIGIDITHLAISLIERRLKDAFPGIAFDVHGTPKDMDGARDLARRDKYQFQWWAVSLIDAQPYGGKKKGADGGIDGLIYFRGEGRTTERAVVSVKGGDAVGVPMIRDLKGVLDRERAPIGVFLTLAEPTRPMLQEAAAAGFHSQGGRQYPRLQIITVAQALLGVKPAIPLVDTGAAFKRAAREQTGTQEGLDL